eukprot:s3639_g4.t2
MVCMEPSALGNEPLIQSWGERLPRTFKQEMSDKLKELMLNCPCPEADEGAIHDGRQLCQSHFRLMVCYFYQYIPTEAKTPSADEINKLQSHLVPLYFFTLIWSIGATCDNKCHNRQCGQPGRLKVLVQPGRRCQEAAVDVAVQQVEDEADLLDVNLDLPDFDSKAAMGKFVRRCAVHPRVSKLPLIISSMSWEVIAEGLKSTQGKCIVNGISMASSEEEFVRVAAERFGAAIVVLAMSRADGEFPNYQEKVTSCQRAFPPEDFIFDCLVTPLGSHGIRASPKDFIDAVAEVRRTCPGVSFIAGVSNLGVACRSAAMLREALASTFLQQAVPVGLNLALVELGRLQRVDSLEDSDRADPEHSAAKELMLPGTVSASVFQTFGSKAHAAANFHRLGGQKHNGDPLLGPGTGASGLMDGIALWERHQGINQYSTTVLWGAIGEIGLRKAIYGSRDVFARPHRTGRHLLPREAGLLQSLDLGLRWPDLPGQHLAGLAVRPGRRWLVEPQDLPGQLSGGCELHDDPYSSAGCETDATNLCRRCAATPCCSRLHAFVLGLVTLGQDKVKNRLAPRRFKEKPRCGQRELLSAGVAGERERLGALVCSRTR